MLLSHKKQFIFIHVYKTGGTSVTRALAKYDYRASLLNRARSALGLRPPVFSSDYPKHISALQLQERLPPELFGRYYKFAFVRNPWDWQVSLYHYMRTYTSHHQHQLIAGMQDFGEYVHWRVNHDLHLQKELICDRSGRLLVDFVGKTENAREDFRNICRRLDITGVPLPHIHQGQHRMDNSVYDYRQYYTPQTRDLIYRAFREDIETFGYEF